MAYDLKDPEAQNRGLFVQNTDTVAQAKEYLKSINDQADKEQEATIQLFELQKQLQKQLQGIKISDQKDILELQQQTIEKAYKHNQDAIEKEYQAKLDSQKKLINANKDLTAKGKQETIDAIDAQLKAEKEKAIKSLEKTAKSLGLDKDGKTTKEAKAKAEKKASQARKKELVSTVKDQNATNEDRLAAWNELKDSSGGAVGAVEEQLSQGLKDGFGNIGEQLDKLITGLGTIIDEQASLKSSIDTRLQGFDGKHWDDMSKDLIKIAGTSPLIKQSELQSKINDMVGQGIAFNVEQRAVLDVMSDTIATTFSATGATLTKLVRIQQQDTTAARLGMESALTSFLNSMYETSEYMSSLAESVRSNLYEAEALMTSKDATSFEYQVEKWLGSLYSVGMDSGTVTKLAQTLGQLASGQISAISSGDGSGTLMVMAANKAGLSVSDILNNGLTDSETNILLQSMVDYLAEISEQAGDSKVIQQQLASVYGLSASDLKAVMNLASSTATVAQSSLDYSAALQQLNYMASTMSDRMSIGEKLSNLTDNFQQTLARSVSSNPALYATYKMADLLDKYADGLEFSIPLVMGTGSTQTYKTSSIMKYGAVGAGLLSNIGNIIGSVGNTLGGGSAILRSLGIGDSVSTVTRGTSASTRDISGSTVSSSGNYIGNSNASDISSKTLTDTTDEVSTQVSAAADESTETTTTTIDNHIVKIYELLQQVTDGTNLRVAIEADNRFTF